MPGRWLQPVLMLKKEPNKFYTEARQHYENDLKRKTLKEETIYAVDMQKVLLLLKLSTKQYCFLSR